MCPQAKFRHRTSHEPNQMLMMVEQRIFLICVRFGSCEVRRLNLALSFLGIRDIFPRRLLIDRVPE